MPQKLFLIDGSNHAFRVFHAMPRMSAGGQQTGALLGFANMLRRFEREHKPDFMVVVFDKGPSFRTKLYADYKGHRPEMPEELREQWPRFPELVEAWGYRSLAIEGLEADDIIGTLAKRWAGPDMQVFLVTGDKDFCQLVDDNIVIMDVMKDLLVDRAGVIERFGVPPEKVIDVMGLSGDASDNVPGVAGVGEKTASQWVQKYGDMEGVIAHAAEIGGKRGATLVEQADMARLSRVLVTIETKCELPLTLDDLHAHKRDTERLRELFIQWQFRSLLKELQDERPAAPAASSLQGGLFDGPAAPPPASALDRSRYRTVDTLEALDAAVAAIRAAGRLAVDTETTSLDPLSAKLVGICLCWSEQDAIYVPVGHTEGKQIPLAEAMARIGPLLADPGLPKTGQNLKYDLGVLAENGYPLRGIAGDTMLADYLLEPDRQRHNLDDLALRYLGHGMISYDQATSGLGAGSTFAEVPIPKATEYGAEDAHVAWLLDRRLNEELAQNGLTDVYHQIELPLIPVLSDMERAGIGIDLERLSALNKEWNQRLYGIEMRCFELAGKRFTLNSPKQLGAILYEELKLPVLKKTKTGASTDADVLERLADMHPLPAAMLEYRGLQKLLSTYVEALPRSVNPKTGRIHTSFHQAVAATGRLSSNDPNLQNIPVRSDDGRRIRECFVAKPGHVFLSCDYSQVELRLLAHYCGEESALADAFRKGEDIHRRTASEVLGIPKDQVSSEQRSAAKAINFGIVYGMSAFRLGNDLRNDLRIPQKQAQEYMDGYFARYPEVRRTMDDAVKSAAEKGYALTLWGRRRPIADLNSRNVRDRMAAERIAINTPIQGSAADVIKLAMVRVFNRLAAEAPDSRLLLQVHDELLLEVPEDRVQALAALVKAEMEGAASLKVPLKVEAGWARAWAGAH